MKVTPFEQDIIDHPVYQRLRRIRQLALTEMVYPGAIHTRFEHSLGVMNVASLMFDQVRSEIERIRPVSSDFTGDDLDRARVMVRLAALLHDVGHAPFSHAGEDVMPIISGRKRFDHEDYSAALIQHFFADIIDNHPDNVHKITANELCEFLGQGRPPKSMLFWRELIKGQMDADRADYLLRDSHHIGVAYGRYDLHRLVATLTVAPHPETEEPTVAVEEGGIQAVEGLIIARYMMFTQVYFHHTRRAYDHHITEVLRFVLEEDYQARGEPTGQTFLPPTAAVDSETKSNLERYVKWSDPRVWDLIDTGRAGPHGELIRIRRHDRVVVRTSATPTPRELLELHRDTLPKVAAAGGWLDLADSAWYKFDKAGIFVTDGRRAYELPDRSAIVKGLEPVFQARVYVPLDSEEKRIHYYNSMVTEMSGPHNAQLDRYGLIAEVVWRFHDASLRLGKTALQKIVFLVQQSSGVDAGYSYTLYTYGPFCADVARDLDAVGAFGGAQVSYDVSCGGYRIYRGPANDEIRGHASAFIVSLSDILDRVVADFGALSAKELELRSTIVYLMKPGTSRDALIEHVLDVKPHFARTVIDSAISVLEQQRYINGLSGVASAS